MSDDEAPRSARRRFDGDRLVVASHNEGKVREIRALLEPFSVTTTSAAELDLDEPDETESTFAGNARIKAHAAAKASGLPSLADDSGLEIDALAGRPGVHTADWAETGSGRDFGMAMAKANALLEEKAAPHPRTGRFVSTLCLAWPDGHDEIFRGEIEGRVVWPPRGRNGFGFDPMFVRGDEDLTFGEISPADKNANCHRSDAFNKLVAACFAPNQ